MFGFILNDKQKNTEDSELLGLELFSLSLFGGVEYTYKNT